MSVFQCVCMFACNSGMGRAIVTIFSIAPGCSRNGFTCKNVGGGVLGRGP